MSVEKQRSLPSLVFRTHGSAWAVLRRALPGRDGVGSKAIEDGGVVDVLV